MEIEFKSKILAVFAFLMLITASAQADSTVDAFTTDGTFNVPDHVDNVDVLVVGAGGGGGGDSTGTTGGGGGGGGGIVYRSDYSVSSGSSIDVQIGSGGAGGTGGEPGNTGGNGGSSSFGSLTAYGGSGGATNDNDGYAAEPANYGAGGGGAGDVGPGAPSTSQGNEGGRGAEDNTNNPENGGSGSGLGGGGGGGQSYAISAPGGDGGDGGYYGDVFGDGYGDNGYFAGGGGGSTDTGGESSGGLGGGGGGQSGCNNGYDGAANTGGGGGAGSAGCSDTTGGSGGSGIVLVKYDPNSPPNNPSNENPTDGDDPVELNPTLSVDVSDPNSDSMDVTFHVDTDNDGTHEYTDTDTGVVNGGTASTSLSSLATSQVVDWYVVADDGDQTKQSTEWNFTTVSKPEMPSDPVPGNESVNVTTDSDLKVNVSHPDGLNLNVDFYIDENRDGSTDQILTDSNVESGGTASVNPALESLEQYSWYTRARTDGFSTERSSEKWKFNTSDGYEVQLSWNDLSKNEAGFKVFTNASGSWQETGETQRNSETFTDQNPNIALGEYVCFGVQAFNTVGYSDAVERCKTIE